MPALITLTTDDGTQVAVRVVHSITIGRGPGNTVRVDERNVSRYHVLVIRTETGDYEVRDGGSLNGTWVNGEPVTQRTLQHSDVLHIGDLVVRFFLVPPLPSDDPISTGIDTEQLEASRRRVAALLEQVDDLRGAVKHAQYEEDQACKERDFVREELTGAKAELEQLRAAHGALEAQLARLEEEGATRTQPQAVVEVPVVPAIDVGSLERRLWESTRLVESLQSQIAQLNQRDAQAVEPRKEVVRLNEELTRTRDRLAATNEVLKTAMARIAALNEEVSRLRVQ